MRYLVTPHKLLDFEQNSFFVDWLSIRQSYEFELPEFNAGVVTATDVHGELIWKISKGAQIVGSYDTSVNVKCDGHTIIFSGNVSRFGRTDNLFGFDLNTCINRVNDILARLGLPAFTMGQKHYITVKTDNGTNIRPVWTGCKITRIDLTANYETGSLSNARAYLAWLATQQTSARIKVGTNGDGETVDWGRGSRRIYAKAYLKSAELRKHDAPMHLVEHCESVGLIRFELTLKATQLQSMGCDYLGGLDMEQLEILFAERKGVLTRAEHTHDDFENLPNAFRRTARDYLAGDDLARHMGASTFRRHRAALVPYGIDIAVKRNVIEFKPRIRVIEVRAASVPSWYDFNERLAA